MAVLKITKRAVDAAPVPAKGDAYFWDTELKGFGLRVTPRGVRSYVVQYRLAGRPARRMTIGVHGSPWTPEKARSRAEDILYDVKRGDDPVHAARKRQRAAVELEFSRYVETFTDGYLRAEWGDTWGDAKRQLELHVIPTLKGRPLPEIEKHEVAAVIAKLRDRPALARNTHAVLRKLFAWAVDQGDLTATPICSPPPAVKARKRVLSPDELVALWLSTFSLGWPMGQFVRLLILTLQRRNEVAALPWTELSELNSMWHQHGDRVKNEEDHLVPLSPAARAVLDEMAAGQSSPSGGASASTVAALSSAPPTAVPGAALPASSSAAAVPIDPAGGNLGASVPGNTPAVSPSASDASGSDVVVTAPHPMPDPQHAAMVRLAYRDPDSFKSLVDVSSKIDAAKAQTISDAQDALATTAMIVRKLPYEQRAARIQSLTPWLMQHHVSQAQITGFDPTDNNLDDLHDQALGTKGIIDQANKDRAFKLSQAEFGERQLHDRAEEATAAQNAATSRGQLGVAQGRLGLAKKVAGRDQVSSSSTPDLLAIARGQKAPPQPSASDIFAIAGER